MIGIITYIYLKFKNYLDSFLINYTDDYNICIFDQPYDFNLIELQESYKVGQIYPNSQIRSNTSPNLNIDRNVFIKSNKNSECNLQSEQILKHIGWFCKTCSKKISRYSNIYCCNDNIFCTPNCRDKFLNYLANK